MKSTDDFPSDIREALVVIAPGEYTVGCSIRELHAVERDKLIHERISTNTRRIYKTQGFLIADFPVTNEQFEAVINDHKRSPRSPDPKLPVVDVTYLEALAFCNHLGMRLPTEDEWELSARAGDLEQGMVLR